MPGRMRWGMVGGGLGSQVGVAHRVAACMDGLFEFSAGAIDIDPAKSRADGMDLGLPEDRAYGSWREMLEMENRRSDRLDLVTVATPNATHFEIVRAVLLPFTLIDPPRERRACEFVAETGPYLIIAVGGQLERARDPSASFSECARRRAREWRRPPIVHTEGTAFAESNAGLLRRDELRAERTGRDLARA